MPIVDMLVDATAKHGVLTFMDGHSGYDQIFMVVEDMYKMALSWISWDI